MNHEQLLRDTLAARAADASVDLTVDDIRRGASRRRSRSRRTAVVVLAAAAAVVVGIPAAILLRPAGDEATPTPSPSPTATSPSPSPTAPAAPKGAAGLRQIPQGRAPGITYLHAGTVYRADGSTTTLPNPTAPVEDFTSYHGGWLVGVGGGDDRVRWYDGTGTRRSDGPGVPRFAVSDDGTRTAYAQSGAIHIGISSGMGSGEQTLPGSNPSQLRPVGFLRDGGLVYQAGEATVVVSGGAGRTPGMARADAVSAAADLVAGEDAQGNTIVVRGDGQVAWTSTIWTVSGFSTDGRYAAATHTTSQSDINAVAILDARTGDVLAEHDGLPEKDYIGGRPVMDLDGSLLVAATTGDLQQTVLRLDRDGTFSRATRVFPLVPSSDLDYVVFATRP